MSEAEEYERLMAAFDALQDAAPSDRAGKLEALRESDPALSMALEELLAADARPYLPLERPVDLSDILSSTTGASTPDLAGLAPSAAERTLPAEVGTSIGLYRLTEVIGHGGMGCVYRAVHSYLGREAAIKVLEPRLTDDVEYVSRFLHEAKVVSALQHPNIVDVFDFIETETPRRVAFVMELLQGATLAETLAQRPLTWEETLTASLQLCGALAAVHEHGVVHRDLKPDNVMVVGALSERSASKPSVKLLDFGIAKVPDPQGHHQTATGVMMGTPAYMAPEQFAAEPATPATDVYALAELIYEMLTQTPAFSGRGLSMMRRKMSGAPLELELPPSVPHQEHLCRLLQDCLRIDAELRPSISEVETILSDPLKGRGRSSPVPPAQPQASPAPVPEAPTTSRSRVRAPTWVAAALVIGLVGWWAWSAGRQSGESQVSEGGVAAGPDALMAERRDRGDPSDAPLPPEPIGTGQAVGSAAQLPAIIYGEPPLNTPYFATGYMGDHDALELDAAWSDNPRSGPTCLRVKFTKASGWAGLAWLDPQDDWGDRPGGLAMNGASRLSWWGRSDIDGLELKVGFGLLLNDKAFYDSDREEAVVHLTKTWRRYEFDLRGKNLDHVKNPFYFALEAPSPDGGHSFYLDDIQFE